MHAPHARLQKRQANALQRAWTEFSSGRGSIVRWQQDGRQFAHQLHRYLMNEASVMMAEPWLASATRFLHSSKPLLLLFSMNALLVAIAYLAATIAPKIFSTTSRGPAPTTSTIWYKFLTEIPHMRARIEQFSAWQGLVTSFVDDAASFLCTYVLVRLFL